MVLPTSTHNDGILKPNVYRNGYIMMPSKFSLHFEFKPLQLSVTYFVSKLITKPFYEKNSISVGLYTCHDNNFRLSKNEARLLAEQKVCLTFKSYILSGAVLLMKGRNINDIMSVGSGDLPEKARQKAPELMSYMAKHLGTISREDADKKNGSCL